MSERGLTRCPSGVGLNRMAPVESKAMPNGLSLSASVYTEALSDNPLGMAFDSTGAILFKPTPDGQRVNPLSDIQNWTDDRIRTRLFGTLFAGYDLTPALSWRVNFGADLTFSRRGQFRGAQNQQWQGSSSDAAM